MVMAQPLPGVPSSRLEEGEVLMPKKLSFFAVSLKLLGWEELCQASTLLPRGCVRPAPQSPGWILVGFLGT